MIGKTVTTHLELDGKTVIGTIIKADDKTFDIKLKNGLVLKDVEVKEINKIF